jgi:uncharacterized protein
MKWLKVLGCGSLLAGCAGAPAPQVPVVATSGAAGGAATPDAALVKAICSGDVKAVELRLSAGIDVNASLDSCTLLQGAAACDQAAVVQLLLERGAKPLARDAKGTTALHTAVWEASPAVIQLLLERGVPVDEATAQGLTPLHQAAMASRLDVVTLLLARGANANARDARGETPLGYAVGRDVPEVVRALLVGGADPTLSRDNRMLVESAESVATFELLRDALWSRRPQAEVTLPVLMLMKQLDQQQPSAVACYERAQPRPSQAELTFVLTIEPDGHVSQAEPSTVEGNLAEPTSVICILDSLRALSFPKASLARRFIHTFQLQNAN